MRVKISDYIASFLAEAGIKHNFTVPGGGAMHLNASFAHQKGIECVYVQHEQAGAIAAEVYARINNEIPVVCCTTGPGGTNTLTGVLGAWLDSIPMLVISGQVRYGTTARSTGLPLRALGDQEFDITPVVKPMTKYAEMVYDPKSVKYHLQKALYIAQNGRPGPVWLDVPLDVQGGYIDTEDFYNFDPMEIEDEIKAPLVDDSVIDFIIEKIRTAKRPVFNTGNGIRIAGAKEEFDKAVALLNIPVVVGFDAIDVIETENPLFVGRAGLIGDRAGNFVVQNSDLLISVGSRLSVRQVGYDVKTWARAAYTIVLDVDEAELKKPSIHVDLPIHADAGDFLRKLNDALANKPLEPKKEWIEKCSFWKKKYPVIQKEHYEEKELANPYCFINELSKRLKEGQVTVTGNGTACVVSSQCYTIKHNQRYIMNSGAASMGYDLPAAIGAAFATNKKGIICLTGDGSIQMNLQELQTIVFHKLPIKIFVINNNGYHSMRQTEANLFPELTSFGIGPESHDLSFPSIEKIAKAYDIPYVSCSKNSEIPMMLNEVMSMDGYLICEIFVNRDQKFEPKSATKKLPDGRLVSPPLEDLAPFLPREELKSNMLIPMIGELD